MPSTWQTAILHLAAADAAPRGISTGDRVRAVQRPRLVPAGGARGSTRCAPAWSRAPAVRWGKRAPGRRNANALTSDRLTDAGGGPTFYSCLVEVERIGD